MRQIPHRMSQIEGLNPENGKVAATAITSLPAGNCVGASPKDLTAQGIHPAYKGTVIFQKICKIF
jgi:hypothetical protein